MTPGTIGAPYNPVDMYRGPSPVQSIANNPNFSPTMLGGQQNAGMMTDRLGNRIYSPMPMPVFGFAKGGEADINAMRALVDASNMADEGVDEVVLDTDPVGSAQTMLRNLSAAQAPRAQTVERISQRPIGGGSDRPKGMAVEYESLTTAKAPKPKGAKSAQAQLKALAKAYQLKKQAADNAARGLMSNTLGAPTLEKPTLTQDTLTASRFAKGGQALSPFKKAYADARRAWERGTGGPTFSFDGQSYSVVNREEAARQKAQSQSPTRGRGYNRAPEPEPEPGPTAEQLALYEKMMQPGRDAIEPIYPELAFIPGGKAMKEGLGALRGAMSRRAAAKGAAGSRRVDPSDDVIKSFEDYVRSRAADKRIEPTLDTRRFAKGGEAKKAEEAEGSDGPSASALLRRLGLAVARGIPQAVTGVVDLAALPLTATGRMKAEDVVGTTDYLTKRGLLPKPQEGLASESAELLSSMASPGGAAKAAMLGILGPKGIIEAARRSKLFKGPGMTVPQEDFSSAEMLKRLEEQGIDTSRTWLRGKKEPSSRTFPQLDYDTLEYLYSSLKNPDAVEAALRDSRRSQEIQGRTLSRQLEDRDVTKFNTKGGVWLTESPSIAQTYTGERGYVIPVYAPKPDVKLDAKGEQWSDFYRTDKDWKEAFADPKVRLVEVKNVIDAGTHWGSMVSPNPTEEELRALLTATNLFAKKPFNQRVVNKLTGEPFEFKHGGAVKHAA